MKQHIAEKTASRERVILWKCRSLPDGTDEERYRLNVEEERGTTLKSRLRPPVCRPHLPNADGGRGRGRARFFRARFLVNPRHSLNRRRFPPRNRRMLASCLPISERTTDEAEAEREVPTYAFGHPPPPPQLPPRARADRPTGPGRGRRLRGLGPHRWSSARRRRARRPECK